MEQIAKFMGKSLSDDVIDKITTATTFKSMKKNPDCDVDKGFEGQVVNTGSNNFFRKGLSLLWYFFKQFFFLIFAPTRQ